MEKGHYTKQEIYSQPQAWQEALKVIKNASREISDIQARLSFQQVIFTGCGSTYYLALAAAAINQKITGLQSRAFPASELWLNPESSYSDTPTLLVAVSRSGETTETLHACKYHLEKSHGPLLTLSCYAEMPLAGLGSTNLVFPSGQEKSIAQTRAFSTLFLAAVAISCMWAKRVDLMEALNRLPEAGSRLIGAYSGLAAELGRNMDTDRFYWLGSGSRYGLASELSLKMKEMSLSHSEPFHFMEFRHGPISMVNPSTLVVGLTSAKNESNEHQVLQDIRHLGGKTVDLSEHGATVEFNSGLDESIRDVLYLPFGQILAFERSIAKGFEPDKPNNLNAVVKLG